MAAQSAYLICQMRALGFKSSTTYSVDMQGKIGAETEYVSTLHKSTLEYSMMSTNSRALVVSRSAQTYAACIRALINPETSTMCLHQSSARSSAKSS